MRRLEHEGPIGRWQVDLELWELDASGRRPAAAEVRWSWLAGGGVQVRSQLERDTPDGWSAYLQVLARLGAGEHPDRLELTHRRASDTAADVIRRAIRQEDNGGPST